MAEPNQFHGTGQAAKVLRTNKMAKNLVDVIPHTGQGAALFPFLNDAELEKVKRTCKTLKGDVEEQKRGDKYKAAPPPLSLIQKEGTLYISIFGELHPAVNTQKSFFFHFTPKEIPLTREECDSRIQKVKEKYGEDSPKAERIIQRLKERIEQGRWGMFCQRDCLWADVPLFHCTTRGELEEWIHTWKRLCEVIKKEEEHISLEKEKAEKAAAEAAYKKPCVRINPNWKGSTKPTNPWKKE